MSIENVGDELRGDSVWIAPTDCQSDRISMDFTLSSLPLPDQHW